MFHCSVENIPAHIICPTNVQITDYVAMSKGHCPDWFLLRKRYHFSPSAQDVWDFFCGYGLGFESDGLYLERN
jgi:hypothetical protein